MRYIGHWNKCLVHLDKTGHSSYTRDRDDPDLWWCDDCLEDWEVDDAPDSDD